MSNARKSLEQLAVASFDKTFTKCVHLLTSESLQFEHEIHAQIDSLSCTQLDEQQENNTETNTISDVKNMKSLCDYFEENYVQSYKQLLKDKHLSKPVKSLMNNQLQKFLSSLTQLHLLNDVQASVN